VTSTETQPSLWPTDSDSDAAPPLSDAAGLPVCGESKNGTDSRCHITSNNYDILQSGNNIPVLISVNRKPLRRSALRTSIVISK